MGKRNKETILERLQMAKTHLRRYSTSLIIREIQLKSIVSTASYPLAQTITRIVKDVEKLERLYNASGNENSLVSLEKLGSSSKT